MAPDSRKIKKHNQWIVSKVMIIDNRINFTKAIIDALPIPESGKRDIYHDT